MARKIPKISYAHIGDSFCGGLNSQWREFHQQMAEAYGRSDLDLPPRSHERIAKRVFSKSALSAGLASLSESTV